MTTTLPSSSFELGGTVPTACLCLLDGFEQDSASGEKTRVTIPITTLPATLGRSNDENDGDDPHFFGLGKKKALSRKQCRISYRDAEGGHVERDGATGELIFREKSALGNQGKLPTEGDEDLPPRGFFVIECLGKNRIMVNQDRVEHGDAAVLEDGSALRISSYCLYFLRPTPSHSPPKEHIISKASPLPPKKRKLADTVPSSSSPAVTSGITPSVGGPAKKAKSSTIEELENLPVEVLLEKMNTAIENDQWDRKHQLIGTFISLCAVKDSAKDPQMQLMAEQGGGVSRSEIMTWIEESDKYAKWVKQMLSKMEARSYQAAITKCLLKAGFTRTGSSGRYIKWLLPKGTPMAPSTTTGKAPPSTKKSVPQKDGEDEVEEEEKSRLDDEKDEEDEGEEGEDEQQDNEENPDDDEEEEEEEEDDDEQDSNTNGQEQEDDEDDEEEGERQTDDRSNSGADDEEDDNDSGSEIGRHGFSSVTPGSAEGELRL